MPTVLITGAARRVGRAIAVACHAAGMHVAIHYRNAEKEAFALRDELNAKRKNSAALFHADLNDSTTHALLIQKVIDHFGSLDALVNNASTFYKTPLADFEYHLKNSENDLFASNLKAPLALSYFAFPYLQKQKGCIVNITDIHANMPFKDYTIYSLAKAGLRQLTKQFACEFSPDVRVNSIAPGMVCEPEGDNLISNDIAQKIRSQIPLQRFGSPEDIAACALFLIRDALYMTGQTLAVDGGRTLLGS